MKTGPAKMLATTVAFSGSFATGAMPSAIKAGETVKVTEYIERPLFGPPTPTARVETRDGRWAWVSPKAVEPTK